jgi:pantoate--beta-alanine ligase
VLEKIETVAALRERLRRSRATEIIGLVPTMGALHAGHAELINTARRECDVVVVSIFVNPLQFDNPDDLARYPRTLDTDLALCRDLRVDVVFAPSPTEVYPEAPECTVDIGRLGDHLCGRFRPGHFRGVATVVLKLFQMVQPHRAYFGEKDAQQLAIIRRLVADFNVPLAIVEVPTVREPDGLAMSSRNRHLSPAQRALAVHLYEAIREGARAIETGERRPAAVKAAAVSKIPASNMLRLEYLEIVDPVSIQPVDEISAAVRIAGALWVGSTRLIDNVLVARP